MTTSFESSFASIPEAMKPIYTTPSVNESVRLYEGPVTLSSEGQNAQEASGVVCLAWLPWPRLELSTNTASSFPTFGDQELCTVAIPGRLGTMPVRCISTSEFGGENARSTESRWLFDAPDKLPDGPLSKIFFHLANGPDYVGTPIRDEPPNGSHTGRASLEGGPWLVTLDSIADWHKFEMLESLKSKRGHAITHICQLERVDGQPFARDDTVSVFSAIGSFLSFCCVRRTNPILLVTQEYGSSLQYRVWREGGVDAHGGHQSWFNELSSEGFKAFAGMYDRLQNSLWNEPIRHALHWYIVANKPAPVSIEGCIILQQAAFELLSWTLLVEDRRVLSEDGIQKLSASDRIRLMLSTCGIPLEIPIQLSNLSAVGKAENWKDGPQATTELRNSLVHPSPKKRARFQACQGHVSTEAWMLGQWYLELILLWLFGYTGKYSNRLYSGVWRGQEVEPVPWINP